MKRRHLYLLVFGVPALLVAIVASMVLFGGLSGILWIFVFGDDSWPPYAEALLTTVFALGGLALWAVLLAAAYRFGKAQEAATSLNLRPLLAGIGATALLALIVVAHQRSVGNIGPRSASIVCSEFCQGKGYAGSGMPPRDSGAATCSCYDAQGREAVKVPLSEVAPREGG